MRPNATSLDSDTKASHDAPPLLLEKRDWFYSRGLGARRARRLIYTLLLPWVDYGYCRAGHANVARFQHLLCWR